MEIWRKGSTPPPGEYEFIARTGGRVAVWVSEKFVMINGEPKSFEEIFAAGDLVRRDDPVDIV